MIQDDHVCVNTFYQYKGYEQDEEKEVRNTTKIRRIYLDEFLRSRTINGLTEGSHKKSGFIYASRQMTADSLRVARTTQTNK